MKIAALALIGALSLAGSALAQPPQEIVATDTIEIRAGQSRTLMFDKSVSKLTLGLDGVAQVVPETDRTFTIRGINPGRTLMTAYGSDGTIVHRSNILVEQSRGYVRIYGYKGKDYIGYYCTGLGCSRADPDTAPAPFATIVSETQNKGDGNSVTTSREYR